MLVLRLLIYDSLTLFVVVIAAAAVVAAVIDDVKASKLIAIPNLCRIWLM